MCLDYQKPPCYIPDCAKCPLKDSCKNYIKPYYPPYYYPDYTGDPVQPPSYTTVFNT